MLAAWVVWLVGCDQSVQGKAGGEGAVAAAAKIAVGQEGPEFMADWPSRVRFGVVPIEGGADTRERFAPLGDHLSKRLGVPVDVVSASSYQGVITAMANDQLDFAYYGPKSYVEAARRAKAEAMLLELSQDGEPGYRSIFIVPAGSDAQTLSDTRGRGFVFTDPNSTSGYLIPATIVYDRFGEPAETFFSEVRFSGAHGTSMLQVAAGEVEVAATNDLDLNRMIQKGALRRDQVKVVHTSDLIPGSPIASRRDLPASLKRAVAEALLEFNDRPEILERFQCGGYLPVDDSAYDLIRATEAFMASQSGGAAE